MKENFKINFNKSVLIIIDMVKGFTDMGELKSYHIKKIGEAIQEECSKFKNIVAINDCHKEQDNEFNIYPVHCLENSIECEVCDELKNVKFTHVLFKNSTNGFFSKGFLDVFHKYIKENYDFVVVGCCTDICVLQFCLTFQGYLHSINSKSNLVVVKELVDTYDSEKHNREYLNEAAFNLMDGTGVILINTIM